MPNSVPCTIQNFEVNFRGRRPCGEEEERAVAFDYRLRRPSTLDLTVTND